MTITILNQNIFLRLSDYLQTMSVLCLVIMAVAQLIVSTKLLQMSNYLLSCLMVVLWD